MKETRRANGTGWVHVDELKPWEKNPRKNDPAVPKVMASIREFGFVAPIVVWRGGNRMVAGHTRLKAMRALLKEDEAFTAKGAPGPAMVRVVFHEFESEAQADAYALADNKLGMVAAWDDSLLLEQLGAMSETLIAASGFDAILQGAATPTQPPRQVTFTAGATKVDVDGMVFQHRCPRCSFEF